MFDFDGAAKCYHNSLEGRVAELNIRKAYLEEQLEEVVKQLMLAEIELKNHVFIEKKF